MGWRPHEVRAVSVSDFNACIEVWMEAQGVKPAATETDIAAQRRAFFGEQDG